MSYKHLLMHRYRTVDEAQVESGPLDYLAFRNLESLRAWQKRRWSAAGQVQTPPPRAWLKSMWRSEIQPGH